MRKLITLAIATSFALNTGAPLSAKDLSKAVSKDYQAHLESLFKHFHAKPPASEVLALSLC